MHDTIHYIINSLDISVEPSDHTHSRPNRCIYLYSLCQCIMYLYIHIMLRTMTKAWHGRRKSHPSSVLDRTHSLHPQNNRRATTHAQDADESLAIDNELLCEIEAESWVNGTRGILVESRAPVLPRLEQNCTLLPAPSIDGGRRAAKMAAAAAAAALEKEGADALYSMPWQKLQVG